jgi:hypothetical protein
MGKDVLVYKSTNAAFVFGVRRPTNANYLVLAFVEVERLIQENWRRQYRWCRGWLGDVKREVETPDLWAQLSDSEARSDDQQAFWQHVADDADNTPFTAREQEQIAERLEALRRQIIDAHALTADKIAPLDAGISHLIEASRRVGRKDWLVMFIGVMCTLVATAVIRPDYVSHLIQAFVHGLESMYRPGAPGLPPGI